MRTPTRAFMLSQAFLYVGLALAILLKWQGLSANDGISYYGIFVRTFLPFAIGLFGSAFFCLQAATYLTNPELKPIRACLTAAAILTIIIVVTPYSDGTILDWAHTIAGSILFSLQLLLSGWLVVKLRYNVVVTLFSLIELGAGIACAFYLHPSHGFLLQFQVIFQLAFGALLVYSLTRLKPDTALSTH